MQISSLPKSPTAVRSMTWAITIVCAVGLGALMLIWRQANLIPPWEMSDVTAESYWTYLFRLWMPVLLMTAGTGGLVWSVMGMFLPSHPQQSPNTDTAKPAERKPPRRRKPGFASRHVGIHRASRAKRRVTSPS